MPRQARLDAFRTSSGIFDRPLHQVMVRGLERRGIFFQNRYKSIVVEAEAYLLEEVCGHPGRPLGAVLGVRPQAVYQAVARGRQAHGEWGRLLRA